MIFQYDNASNKAGIYRITNTHTGRTYVGQASRFERRWSAYKRNLPKGTGHNKFLINDYLKCREELGHDDFLVFSIVEVMEGSTRQQRNDREETYIASVFDNQKQCYNMRKDTQIIPGEERNPELARLRRSLAQKGRPSPHRGRKHTGEALERLRHSKDHLIGVPLTDEHRRKISESSKGYKKTVKHRKALSRSLTGRRMSPEAIEKMRATKIGKKQSPEVIAKRVAAIVASKARKKALRQQVP